MRRWAFLLSLFAALAGRPLRQSEAAFDHARTLADPSHVAELAAPDGGVGDDDEAGSVADAPAPDPAAPGTGPATALPAPVSPRPAAAHAARPLGMAHAPPAGRCAWLQVFRL